jgi:hypothetical protein
MEITSTTATAARLTPPTMMTLWASIMASARERGGSIIQYNVMKTIITVRKMNNAFGNQTSTGNGIPGHSSNPKDEFTSNFRRLIEPAAGLKQA